MADLERDLIAVTRRYSARVREMELAEAERDRVIRDAIEAKLAKGRIGALTGLSAKELERIAKRVG